MRKIYSKLMPDVLMHVVHCSLETDVRDNLCDDGTFLQMACLKLSDGQTFKAHKHIEKIAEVNTTHESWVVVKGRVKAILYDLDDTILEEVELWPGDCSITFCGGHNYLCLEDDTLVYEAKSGPYLGIEKDKVFV